MNFGKKKLVKKFQPSIRKCHVFFQATGKLTFFICMSVNMNTWHGAVDSLNEYNFFF